MRVVLSLFAIVLVTSVNPHNQIFELFDNGQTVTASFIINS